MILGAETWKQAADKEAAYEDGDKDNAADHDAILAYILVVYSFAYILKPKKQLKEHRENNLIWVAAAEASNGGHQGLISSGQL